MTQKGWGAIAVGLVVLIVGVVAEGQRHLPSDLKRRIHNEQTALTLAQSKISSERDELARDLKSEPDLFRTRAAILQQRLDRASASLKNAERTMTELDAVSKRDSRKLTNKAEELIRTEKDARISGLAEAESVVADANRRLDMKRNLPRNLDEMQRAHDALRAFDVAALTSVVAKAEQDWPAKKTDLDSRLSNLKTTQADGDKAWQQAEAARKLAAEQKIPEIDFNALSTASQDLSSLNRRLESEAVQVKSLTGQLYNSWDKVLVDLQRKNDRAYEEKIRTITTHLTDIPANKSDTKSAEQWVEVTPSQFRSVENDLGMTIEHKAAGKYDSESERVAQPPGFAYMAAPGQANQYGHWEQRDGGSFWTWFPQYLIMRDLLWNHNYRPLNTYEYQNYRYAQQRGQTYYGGTPTGSGTEQKYGSHGTFTQSNYANSRYVSSGTYSGSKYATSGGTYRGSGYQSGGSTNQGGGYKSEGGTRFGASPGSREPPPSHARPPSGGGRRFGGRRR